MDLAAEFARRGPWITQFVIDGVATGGDYQVTDDRRVQQFLERSPVSGLFSSSDRSKAATPLHSPGTKASSEFLRSKHAPGTSTERNSLAPCLAFQTYNLSRPILNSSIY